MNHLTANNRILSLTLAICLMLTVTMVVPGPMMVSADVGFADGQPPDIVVYETMIGFAGHRWVVIGDESTGVKTGNSNYITLLLEKDDTGFGSFEFRAYQHSSTSPGGNWKQYPSGGDFWYEGDFSSSPNEYNDSTLQREMVVIAGALQSSAGAEYGLIVGRNIADGIGGEPVGNQDLWPLSEGEYYDVWNATRKPAKSELLCFSSGDWWLRSPGYGDLPMMIADADGLGIGRDSVNAIRAVRPALQLDLGSVIFISDMGGAGAKSFVNDTNGFVDVRDPGNEIKLTVEDHGLAVDIDNVAASGNVVNFTYTVASGSPNRLSAIVRDEDGAVTFYGNLKDHPGTSGAARLTLPVGFDPDKDTLEVFVEEIKSSNHTDFASKPQKLDFILSEPAKLEITAPTFATVALEYIQPAAQAITIKNTGGTDAAITDVQLSGGDSGCFILTNTNSSDLIVPANSGTNTTWTIQPVTGLGEKTYASTITLTYDGGENQTGNTAAAEVQFVVQAGPSAPGVPTLSATPTDLSFEDVAITGTYTRAVSVTGTDLMLPIGYSVSGTDAAVFAVDSAPGWSDTDGGELQVTFSPNAQRDYAATLTISNNDVADVVVSLTGKGVSEGEGGLDPDRPGTGSGSSTVSRSRSSSGGRSSPDNRGAKIQLPLSAFSWDEQRTLTIDHERITPLGLLSVQWDRVPLTLGVDYSVYQGSVIIRFSEDFIAAQTRGTHIVQVEFLNHTGEITVLVGDADLADDGSTAWDNDTHNPNTGGEPGSNNFSATDTPNTGDGGGIWTALLLGGLSAAVLSLHLWSGKRIVKH